MLSKEDLKKVQDRPIQPFPLDEALYGQGAELLLRSWDGAERSRIEKDWANKARKDPASFRWEVIRSTVVDADGAPYFTDEDRQWFMGANGTPGKSAATIEALFEKCGELNGLREQDVKGLAGNSEADQ